MTASNPNPVRSARPDHHDTSLDSWPSSLTNDLHITDAVAPHLLERALQLQRARRELRTAFPPHVFRECSWDIVLNCFVAKLERRQLCVKQLNAELSESSSALLRRLAELEHSGVLQRTRDDLDGRRTVVRLTPQAEVGVRQMLEKLSSPDISGLHATIALT